MSETIQKLTQEQMVEAAKQRDPNYNELSPEEQWAEDKRLGILDWDGKDLDGGVFTPVKMRRADLRLVITVDTDPPTLSEAGPTVILKIPGDDLVNCELESLVQGMVGPLASLRTQVRDHKWPMVEAKEPEPLACDDCGTKGAFPICPGHPKSRCEDCRKKVASLHFTEGHSAVMILVDAPVATIVCGCGASITLPFDGDLDEFMRDHKVWKDSDKPYMGPVE